MNTIFHKLLRYSLLLTSALGCFHSALAGIDPNEAVLIANDLQQPITVNLQNGESIEGHPISLNEAEIEVAQAEGAGAVTHTIPREDVKSIHFPGESYKILAVEWMENGETAKAEKLFNMIFQQRVKFLAALPASESNFFIYYANLLLDKGNPERALAVTELLKDQITNPKAIEAIEDTILQSYYVSGLYSQVKPLAEKWVKSRNPYTNSGLGYFILATDYLRDGEFQKAMDLALQPIVFTSPVAKEKLDECYAVAIAAALELRDQNYAIILHQEMEELKLAWPMKDPTLMPYFDMLSKVVDKKVKD